MNSKATVLILGLIMAAQCVTIQASLATSEDNTNQTSVPAAGNWTQKTPMPTARYDLGVAVVDGKIYAIGGKTYSGTPTAVNEMYDPKTDTWTQKAPLPTLRVNFAIAVYEDKIYCIGGVSNQIINAQGKYGSKVLGTNEVYDPATDTWTYAASLPFGRSGAKATVADGLIYVVGGDQNASINQAYNPRTDTWTDKAPVYYVEQNVTYKVAPYPDGTVVTLDGKMYWIGSVRSFNQSLSGTMNMLVYNADINSWSKASQPPEATFPDNAVSITGVYAPKQIYVVGAVSSIYNLEADQWIGEVAVPARPASGLAVVDDKIYCLGGNYIDVKVQSPKVWSLMWIYTVTDQNIEYLPYGYGTVPPQVQVTCPVNGSHVTDGATLNVTANKPCQIWYSIDGATNITAAANTTLNSLPLGTHSLVVYAVDTYGNVGKSETVTFAVDLPATIWALTATVAVTAAAGTALLVVKHRNKQTLQ